VTRGGKGNLGECERNGERIGDYGDTLASFGFGGEEREGGSSGGEERTTLVRTREKPFVLSGKKNKAEGGPLQERENRRLGEL